MDVQEPATTGRGAQFRSNLIWSALKQNLVLLGLAALLFGGIAFAYVFLAKPSYQADATLVLPLPDPNAPIPQTGAGRSTPLDILRGVLTQPSGIEKIAASVKKPPLEVQRMLNVELDFRTNQIGISAQSTDADLALAVVTESINSLQELTTSVDFSFATRRARELQRVVEESAQELRKAESALRDFQKKAQTAPNSESPSAMASRDRVNQLRIELAGLEQQINAVRGQASEVARAASTSPAAVPSDTGNAAAGLGRARDRFLQAQYDLNVAEVEYGPGSPVVNRLRRELEIARQELNAEAEGYSSSAEKGLTPGLSDLVARKAALERQLADASRLDAAAPDEAIAFQDVLRNYRLATDTYGTARKQYEDARIAAIGGEIRWSVLAPPALQPEPTNKRYLRTTLIGAFLGLLVGAAFAIRRSAFA